MEEARRRREEGKGRDPQKSALDLPVRGKLAPSLLGGGIDAPGQTDGHRKLYTCAYKLRCMLYVDYYSSEYNKAIYYAHTNQ